MRGCGFKVSFAILFWIVLIYRNFYGLVNLVFCFYYSRASGLSYECDENEILGSYCFGGNLAWS